MLKRGAASPARGQLAPPMVTSQSGSRDSPAQQGKCSRHWIVNIVMKRLRNKWYVTVFALHVSSGNFMNRNPGEAGRNIGATAV